MITGPLISPISRDRLAGVRHTAIARGHADTLTVVAGDFSIESGAAQGEVLLAQPTPPTAIFCFSDEMAMGAMFTIRHLGLSCPRDISVVGFDDIRFARYLDPPLTTVSQPTEQIGHEVVSLLLEILSGNGAHPRHITLPHRLIVRSSTAAPP